MCIVYVALQIALV